MCQTLTKQAKKDEMRDSVMFSMLITFKTLRKIILLHHFYEKTQIMTTITAIVHLGKWLALLRTDRLTALTGCPDRTKRFK